jgi:hypothetical protein
MRGIYSSNRTHKAYVVVPSPTSFSHVLIVISNPARRSDGNLLHFTTDNSKSARELVVILKEAKASVPPQLEEMAMFGGAGGGRSMDGLWICLVASVC